MCVEHMAGLCLQVEREIKSCHCQEFCGMFQVDLEGFGIHLYGYYPSEPQKELLEHRDILWWFLLSLSGGECIGWWCYFLSLLFHSWSGGQDFHPWWKCLKHQVKMKYVLLFKLCLTLAIEELKIKIFNEMVWWDHTGLITCSQKGSGEECEVQEKTKCFL